jgi:hypothetical protein
LKEDESLRKEVEWEAEVEEAETPENEGGAGDLLRILIQKVIIN